MASSLNNLRSIFTNFGIASVSRLILGGISLVIVGFLTRYLGASGYGDYSAILAYLFLFTILADLGLYSILVREISKPGADEAKITSNIFSLRLVVVIGAVILANIIVLFLPYSRPVKTGVILVSVYMVLSSLSQVLMGVFQKHLKLYLVSVSDMASRLFQLGLVVLLVYVKASFLYFMAAISASEIIHFGLIFSFARKITRIKFAFDKEYWIETVKAAIPIAVSLVFVLIYFKVDTFLLSLMKPSEDVGIYSVAYKVLEFIIFFAGMYLGLVMPLLSKYAVGDPDHFKKIFINTFNKLAMFGLPVTFFIFLTADKWTILLGGGVFQQSGPVLQILSIAVLMIFFGNLGGHSLIALNLQKKGMWIYLSGMVLNLIGNLIFIPRYSYMAAAWTTVGTEVLVTIWMFWVIKNKIGIRPEYNVLIKAIFASCLMGLFVSLFSDSNIIIVSLSALIYWPILYLLKGVKLSEIGLKSSEY